MDLSSSFLVFETVPPSGLDRSNADHIGSVKSPFQLWTIASASKTVDDENSGRVMVPTVTLDTAGLSFMPPQSEHGSSVIYAASLDRVRSELVSVRVRRSLAKTPSQGLFMRYDDPLSDWKWKPIVVDPVPFNRMSL